MINIGNLHINGNMILAPMAGLTDSPYRRIAKKNGAALVYTELISAEGIVRYNRKTADLMKFSDEERPVGIQLFGSNPLVMAEAAKKVESLNPDFIDINLGCSVRRVLRGNSGAALLGEPLKLAELAYKVVNSVRIPVSAKIRIGIDTQNLNYPEIIRILQESGISFIAVHGRTRAQAFKGEADWNIIREIKRISRLPVIGNGDIKSYAEAMNRLESSGCDGVMIGRAAMGNPWIFSGHVPDNKEIVKQIEEHLDLMLDFYGEKGIILFRKHIVKYIRGMKDSAKLRSELVNAAKKMDIINIINNYIAD
jgi:tRNA-dihydrouridine synthase B